MVINTQTNAALAALLLCFSSTSFATAANNSAINIPTSNMTNTTNMVECDMSTMHSVDIYSVASAIMAMDDGDDLNYMTSMGLACVDDNEAPATYVKTQSFSREMGSGAIETVWQGAMESDRLGFATLMRGSNGTWTGSFTTEVAAYSVTTMPNGTTQVKKTMWQDFADVAGIIASSNASSQSNNTAATASTSETETDEAMISAEANLSVEASFFLPGYGGRLLTSSASDQATDHPELVPVPRYRNRNLRGGQLSRSLQQTSVADVLVLVTNAAMCQTAGMAAGCEFNEANSAPMQQRIALLQEQTNNAMQGVGAAAGISVVSVTYYAAGYEGNPDQATLDFIRNSADIQQRRRDVGADLVAMIVGSGDGYCGLGYLNAAETVTRQSCLDSFAFTHEIGHNFGAMHNREDSSTQLPYGHGVRVPGQFRTVMSYQCPDGSCNQAIPYFSANGFSLRGVSIGDPSLDNARLLSENAAQTAGFMQRRVM